MRESNDPEAKQVLGELKLRGVMIELDEESVIRAIESILNRYLPCYWGTVIPGITSAIKRELVRSRNTIDADLVREVDEYFKKQGKKKQGMGDEWSDEDEPEDSDVGWEEVEESSSDSEDDVSEGKTEEAAKEEEIDHFKDPTVRKECIDVLSYLAGKKGTSVKQGDEEAIMESMIPHLRDSITNLCGIMGFLDTVIEYMDECSRLDNLEIVETALRDRIFVERYEQYKVKSKKNLVPTKEEGIATPMNQITQEEEKRESGDIMEIQETETSMIPLDLPEQPKESMGNAYSCIKESLERAGGNKRKLAQV
ncbi:PREDICTED: uncharacterized protein LOC101308184 isoform X1 [Fragaria vesca subsp. vesca]|uniref:uncharacterized protein LOC101308184 isoform X1 n=1 Tax=Fragaria vesca subsp. vesca TaxID=101020 RepID=UPI0002C32B89|nr:PREDICTED: uncharacterized protein LOC101308184 isoform X1 [Fragaria vesca subsp. vesca]XP_011463873.1 PREDICTED: uncharacterized protein LOC101308184 isoform X1 [Fragaria vesca subsp. vesca]